MMWFIYNIGIYIYFLILSPYFLFNLITREKYRAGLVSRLGLNNNGLRSRCAGRETIWFHAVSVGEVLAIFPLIDSTRKLLPNYNIVLSTTTLASNRLAKKEAGAKGVEVIYFPLDFDWAVRRVISAVDPRLIVLTETELWPNFLNRASEKKIPVILVNGRISKSSFKSYRLIKGFFRDFTGSVRVFGMQSELYRDNIVKLGAEKSRVTVSGNLKYDAVGDASVSEDEKREIKSKLGIPAENTVIFGGSTHPGEEEILIEIFAGLKKELSRLSIFVAPRHVERAASIVNIAKSRGLTVGLKTEIVKNHLAGLDVIVLDTIGELSRLYAIGDIVFVGKSITASGGQNILEPARLGKAVIFGPRMDNFRDEAAALLAGGGAIQVEDASGLEKALRELLNDRSKIADVGEKASGVVKKYRGGIIEKNLALIRESLGQKLWN